MRYLTLLVERLLDGFQSLLAGIFWTVPFFVICLILWAASQQL